MTKRKKNILLTFIFLCLLVAGLWIVADNYNAPYQKMEGKIFGTYYHITYKASSDYENDILEQLNRVDASLSTFNAQSVVSRVNRNEKVKVDDMFKYVFNLAQDVSDHTNGSFDITVAPLVNLWGFGFKNKEQVNKAKVDSIMPFVGYKGVKLVKDYVVKQHQETMLDFSAIAKGYGCDVVADFLEAHGVSSYMIEIGGEIRANGLNSEGNQWTLGIEKPVDDSTQQHQELYSTVQMPKMAIATSGNYRNFYYKGGHKYAHTISPFTGYPIQHKLLSATVCAPTCAMADAYATAFMVMGLDKAKKLLEDNNKIKAYFIYTNDKGQYQTWCSETLKKYIDE